MTKIIIIISIMLGIIWPISAYAQGGDTKVFLMSHDDIAQTLENTKGEKRALVLLGTNCTECHKKFVNLLHLDKEKRRVITTIFHSEKVQSFKRYVMSFNEMPIKVVYNRSSQYNLMQSLKKYGVKPWKSLPRVILIDENNHVFGQGNHSAKKISVFLSDENIIKD